MFSTEFRQISLTAESGKAERLFRAAISAFCSLTRPSRREIGQLEDLALPLFDNVSTESLRFVAAALSESEYPPAALIRRLCEETVDIAAPLLIRSVALTDIDLIALIGRHGLPHARAIARRKDLNPTISDLICALERPTLVSSLKTAETPAMIAAGVVPAARIPGAAAEEVRDKLRTAMASRHGTRPDANPKSDAIYAKLRETALTGNATFFQTALADSLETDFATAKAIAISSDSTQMLIALRALDLGEDKAFLIAVAVHPSQFPHPQAIRIFLDRYRALHVDAARDQLERWKADAISNAIRDARKKTANSDRPAQPVQQGWPALRA